MGPLINKNKHFSHSLHLNKSGTKYTYHTYTFLYIYINVNTGKQIEVNTFNLFISSLTRALYAKLMIILAKVYYW